MYKWQYKHILMCDLEVENFPPDISIIFFLTAFDFLWLNLLEFWSATHYSVCTNLQFIKLYKKLVAVHISILLNKNNYILQFVLFMHILCILESCIMKDYINNLVVPIVDVPLFKLYQNSKNWNKITFSFVHFPETM